MKKYGCKIGIVPEIGGDSLGRIFSKAEVIAMKADFMCFYAI